MIFLIFPTTVFGLKRPHTTSKERGISMCNLTKLNKLGQAAIAVPPPLFKPGLGVDMYWIPFNSSSSSILAWCLRFSFFSQISLRKLMSTALSMMSLARLLILDYSERILYTVKAGRLTASRSLLSFLIFQF